MDALPRLLLRFIIVPVGYFAGVLAGTLVILFGSWKIGRIESFDVEARAIAVYGYAFAAPVLLVPLEVLRGRQARADRRRLPCQCRCRRHRP